MKFVSPSKGVLSEEQMFKDIIDFIESNPEASYNVIIGTDSHTRDEEETCFVTAIIIHQIGKGARYYYRKNSQRKVSSLRQKIFFEAALSLDCASKVARKLSENGHSELNVEIHLDIGANGRTKELIKEIVGMVVGSGFDAKIKPESCGATKVADKHTK
ncbi:MAG: hypothetical protein XD50_1120 [Clostridia bacterium 41_269]|nr:MAG: hypothetical protein XD50_1120 [Clostridia bacterium 41_269]